MENPRNLRKEPREIYGKPYSHSWSFCVQLRMWSMIPKDFPIVVSFCLIMFAIWSWTRASVFVTFQNKEKTMGNDQVFFRPLGDDFFAFFGASNTLKKKSTSIHKQHYDRPHRNMVGVDHSAPTFPPSKKEPRTIKTPKATNPFPKNTTCSKINILKRT